MANSERGDDTTGGRRDHGITRITADGAALDPERHGRKARGLQQLLQQGLRVPPAVVIPIDAAAEIAAAVETDDARPGKASDVLGALGAVVEQLRTVGEHGETRFAVRSGAAVSLPGALETVLGVAPENVPEAVAAVVASTKSPRAKTVAKAMGNAEVPPTAVIVQRQVDTGADARSGAGVAMSRDPVTGADGLAGSVAWRQSGDGVMAGTVTVDPIASIDDRCPAVAERLRADTARLERDLVTPVEVEFAIERGELWYLQLRPFTLPDTTHETPPPPGEVAARGRPASPGVATGELHVDPDDALDAIDAGRPVVIALETSSPGDVPVMVRAAGVLTVLGSPGSHAAVVARGAGVAAVVAVQGMAIGRDGIRLGGRHVPVGARITVDGVRGTVVLDG